jgi:hypothetical protein
MRQQQRDLLGRGEQDVGRPGTLALLARGGGIASARLDADRQLHLLQRREQVARHVHGQCLERRHVQRVHAVLALCALAARQCDEARQETGQRLARSSRGDQQGRAARSGLFQQGDLVLAWLPTPVFEPGPERRRQQRWRRDREDSVCAPLPQQTVLGGLAAGCHS